MEKKIYSAPYLKIFNVKHNVIATSLNDQVGKGEYIQSRGMWSEDFNAEEDMYY